MSLLSPCPETPSDADGNPPLLDHAQPSLTLGPAYLRLVSHGHLDSLRSSDSQDAPLVVFCVLCRHETRWFAPLRSSHQPSNNTLAPSFGLSSTIPHTPTYQSFPENKPLPSWVAGHIHAVCAQCKALSWTPSDPYHPSNQEHILSHPSKLVTDGFPSDTTALSPTSESSASVLSSFTLLNLNYQLLETDARSISSSGSCPESGFLDAAKPFRLSRAPEKQRHFDSISSDPLSPKQLKLLKDPHPGLDPSQKPIQFELSLRQKPSRDISPTIYAEIEEILDYKPEGSKSFGQVQHALQRNSNGPLKDLPETSSADSPSSRLMMSAQNSNTTTPSGSPDPGARLRSLLRQAKIPLCNSDQSSADHQYHLDKSFDIWESTLLATRKQGATPYNQHSRHLSSGGEDRFDLCGSGNPTSSNSSPLLIHMRSPHSASHCSLADGGRRAHEHDISQASSFHVRSIDEKNLPQNRAKPTLQVHWPSLSLGCSQSAHSGSVGEQHDLSSFSSSQGTDISTPMCKSRIPVAPAASPVPRRGSSCGFLGRLMVSDRVRKPSPRRPSLGPLRTSVSNLALPSQSSIGGLYHQHSANSQLTGRVIMPARRHGSLGNFLSGRKPSSSLSAPQKSTCLSPSPSPRLNISSPLPSSDQSIFGRPVVKNEPKKKKETICNLYTRVNSPATFTTSKITAPFGLDDDITSISPARFATTEASHDVPDPESQGKLPIMIPSIAPSTPLDVEIFDMEVAQVAGRITEGVSLAFTLPLKQGVSAGPFKLLTKEGEGEPSGGATERSKPVRPVAFAVPTTPKASVSSLGLVQSQESLCGSSSLSLSPEKYENQSGTVSISVYPPSLFNTFHPGQKLTIHVRLDRDMRRENMMLVMSGQFVEKLCGTSHEFLKVEKRVIGSDGWAQGRQHGGAIEESAVELLIPEYVTCSCSPGPLPLPSSGIDYSGAVSYTIELLVKKKGPIYQKDLTYKTLIKVGLKVAATHQSANTHLLTRPMSLRSSNLQIPVDIEHAGLIENCSSNLNYQVQYSTTPGQLEVIYSLQVKYRDLSNFPAQTIDLLAQATEVKLKYQVGNLPEAEVPGVVDNRVPGWQKVTDNGWMIKGSLMVTNLTLLMSQVSSSGTSSSMRFRKEKSRDSQLIRHFSLVVTAKDEGVKDKLLGRHQKLELSSFIGTEVLLSNCALRRWGSRQEGGVVMS